MPELGLSLRPFSAVPCADGFVIACKGFHLTVLFDETRISAHLTRHADGAKLGRAEITVQQLEAFNDYLTHLLFSCLRRVRIKDLIKRRYWLTYDGDNTMEDVFKKHSPISKKKVRPNLPNIIGEIAKPENMEKLFYKPTILCLPTLRRDIPIMAKAVFKKGRLKRPDMGLFYVPFPGREGWYSFSVDDMSGPIQRDVLPRLIKDFGDFGRLVSEKMDLENSLVELVAGLKGNQ